MDSLEWRMHFIPRTVRRFVKGADWRIAGLSGRTQ